MMSDYNFKVSSFLLRHLAFKLFNSVRFRAEVSLATPTARMRMLGFYVLPGHAC